jgi:hypothetical protein
MDFPEINFDEHPAYRGLASPLNDPPAAYVDLVEQIRARNLRFENNWAYPGQTDSGSDSYNFIKRDGITAFRLSERLVTALKQHCEPFFDRIEEQLADPDFKPETSKIRIRSNEMAEGPLKRFPGVVRAIDEETGFIAHSKAYLGCDVGLKVINLKIDNADVSIKSGRTGCFQDCNCPDPRTRYLHADNTCFDMKMIVYLSDLADERDGPFSYIRGSARKRIPFEEFLTRGSHVISANAWTLDPISGVTGVWLPSLVERRVSYPRTGTPFFSIVVVSTGARS